MARRSRMSILKRQREVKKAEKAAQKRAKRLGQTVEEAGEPRPTEGFAELFAPPSGDEDGESREP